MFQSARTSAPPRLMLVFIAIWAVGVGSAWSWLASERATPGPVGSVPEYWPADSVLSRAPYRHSLVLFAHPRCPCVRASLEELAKIAAHYSNRTTIHVVFFKPASADDDWTATDQWRSAVETPGVVAVTDVDGAEARRFGAATSGQTLVYDPDGDLRFVGGITAGRGHAGDNDGRTAVQDVLLGKQPETTRTPVYGCSIVNL